MIYFDTTKESDETLTSAVIYAIWTPLDVTADSGKPTGIPAHVYPCTQLHVCITP